MNFTIDCKILQVAKLKDANKVSVKVLVNSTEELMCTAPTTLYDLLCQNRNEWVKLTLKPTTTFVRISYTEQRYTNRFNITQITPHKTISRFPRMDF